MRGVQLQPVEPGGVRALRGLGEQPNGRADLALCHRPRKTVAIVEGEGARPDRLPSAAVRRGRLPLRRVPDPRAGACWPCGPHGRAEYRRTAPWDEIKRVIRAHCSAWASDQIPASCGEIRPWRFNRGGLGHHQPRPADRPAPQMNQMPVVRHSVFGAVFAHRGDTDPVP